MYATSKSDDFRVSQYLYGAIFNIHIFRFPDTSVIFLYRSIQETVDSFMRVMAAFTKFANLFTDMQEMMDYWLSDLPLPMLPTLYRWARDESMLVGEKNLDKFLSIISESLVEIKSSVSYCSQLVCYNGLYTGLHKSGLFAFLFTVKMKLIQGQQIGCLDYKDLVQSPDKAWESLKKFCNISQHMTTPTDAFNK